MRKNHVVPAMTTLTDTSGALFVVDQEADHFFIGNVASRKVFPISDELWLLDQGVKCRLADFLWELWNESRLPTGHTVVLKGDQRDYRLQNLELVEIPKEKKSA